MVGQRAGFKVESGSGGMPTAFAAEWSNGPGATVAGYAEYDAVPGNCQAAATSRGPRPGLSEFAPGHTDPHSALGIGALGAILATQHAMQRTGVKGTLRFFGEPAEKVQGSKLVHGLRGYYDGIDAMVSFHPFYMLPLCNTTRWDTHCGAYCSRIYSFICDASETWGAAAHDSPIAAAHSAARAPGANVALVTMYALTKATMESMLAHSGGWSLNEAILTAGQATADNLPAQLAQINYAWRAPEIRMADSILEVLDRNADHAAAVSHCRVVKRWVSRTRPGVANHVLAALTYANLAAVGPPHYGSQAIALAHRPDRRSSGQDDRRHAARSSHPTGCRRRRAHRIYRANRRRTLHRTTSPPRLRPAARLPLAGIRHDESRDGLVDSRGDRAGERGHRFPG